ncbi:MAG: hypothetical protein QM831_35205 [Kofleriaceae bacterium]
MQRSGEVRPWIKVLGLLILLIMFALGVTSVTKFFDSRALRRDVASFSEAPCNDLDFGSIEHGKPRRYRPILFCTFTVSGVQYHVTSEFAVLMPDATSADSAKQVGRDWIQAHPAVAYYDPANPGRAVMSREVVFRDEYVMFGLGLISLIWMGVWLSMVIKDRRAGRRSKVELPEARLQK